MVSYSLICILQVTMIVIFRAKNVTCVDVDVKTECIAQLFYVFGGNSTPYSCMKYALEYLSHNMQILQNNPFAHQYYYELMKYLIPGDVRHPRNFCIEKYGSYNWFAIERDISFKYGIINDTDDSNTLHKIVQHAYLNEIKDDEDNSVFNREYFSDVVIRFDMDDEALNLKPSNFCTKENAKLLCLHEIKVIFGVNKDSENACIHYAMSHLRENSIQFVDRVYAKFYYDTLENRLGEEGFLATVADPMEFFKPKIGDYIDRIEKPVEFLNKYLGITDDEKTSDYDPNSTEANKIMYVKHVFRKEGIDETGSSSSSSSKNSLEARMQKDKQLYIRHICDKCSEYDFQTPEYNLSPEFYCNALRDKINE